MTSYKIFAGSILAAVFSVCLLKSVQATSGGGPRSRKNDREPYAMFQSSPDHCGMQSRGNYTSLGSVKWKFKSGGKIFSSPAILSGIVYVGSEDHCLYAVKLNSGRLLWKFQTGGAVDSSPAAYRGIVYFGSFDGYYYAVNAATGSLIWKFKTGGERLVGLKGLWGMKPKNVYMNDQYDFYLSSPVLNFGERRLTVYFGSSDGNLYALNAQTGKKIWSFKTNGLIHSSPALYKGAIYFGSWDTYFYALDAQSGKLKWKFKTGEHPVYHQMEGIQASPTCYNGAIAFGCRDANFYCLEAATGKLLWKKDMAGSWVLTTAAASQGSLYVSTSDTYLFLALDTKTGAEKYRFKASGYIYSSTALCGNTGYFGDFSGRLYALNLTTGKPSGTFSTPGRIAGAGKILRNDKIDFTALIRSKDTMAYATSADVLSQLFRLGPIVSSPAISGNSICFGSADGYLYAINLK